MKYANWGLIEDKISVDQGGLPNALVSKDERRARVMALMVEVMQLAAKLGLGKAALARELGVTRNSLYFWQDGSAVPGMKNYRKLLRLCLKLEKMAFKRGLIRPPRLYARAAQQILILAAALGYKQYQVADALGVVKGTVKRWHNGKIEPGIDSWPKLLALKEQLETTGKLIAEGQEISGNLGKHFEGNIAKNSEKTVKLTPPQGFKEIDTITLIDKGITLNVKGKNTTVLASENGAPNCGD